MPQFQLAIDVTPMKANVIWARMANITVLTKLDAMIAVRFGIVSKPMIRHVDSPVARAAWMKSRRRSESVCARSTRAPHAHPVAASTRATVTEPASGSWLTMMMTSGRPGSTRKMVDSADSASSLRPPRNPAVTPTITASAVAATPATNPTTSTGRVPTSSCESTSWPRWVVPSQCFVLGGCSVSRPSALGS